MIEKSSANKWAGNISTNSGKVYTGTRGKDLTQDYVWEDDTHKVNKIRAGIGLVLFSSPLWVGILVGFFMKVMQNSGLPEFVQAVQNFVGVFQ